MNDRQQVSNVLQEARHLVQQGWCQGSTYVRGPGAAVKARCLVGALVEGHDFASGEAPSPAQQARDLLSEAAGKPITLSAWNDKPGRTVEEVVALIDRVLVDITK